MGLAEKYKYIRPNEFREDDCELTRQDIWRGLKQNTTVHGIPNLTRARGPVKKTFWVITFCLTVGVFIYHISAISMLYADFPVTVSIKLLHETELIFPAVTICNMSPVRKSALESSAVFQDEDRKRKKRRKKRSTAEGGYFCEPGWDIYNQNCYYTSTVAEKQADAREECQNLASDLTSILDQSEADFIKSISTDLTGDQYWVGLYDMGGDIWGWLDGETLGYTNWAPSGNQGNGPCVRTDDFGLWREKSCNVGYRYVCKKPATAETTVAPTTLAETTQPPTTLEATTQPDTTLAETTQPPTILETTTQPDTTLAETTQPPTTLETTTRPDTTLAATTQPPTTLETTTRPDTGTTLAGTTQSGTILAEATPPGGTTLAKTTEIGGSTIAKTTQADWITLAETTEYGGATLAETTLDYGTTLAETTQADGTILAETTQPDTPSPDTTQPDTTLAETTQSDTTLAETTPPDIILAETTQPDEITLAEINPPGGTILAETTPPAGPTFAETTPADGTASAETTPPDTTLAETTPLDTTLATPPAGTILAETTRSAGTNLAETTESGGPTLAETTQANGTTLAETTPPDTILAETTQPDTTLPGTTQPDTTLADTTQSDTTSSDTTLSDTTETTQPDTTLSQTSKAHAPSRSSTQETSTEGMLPETSAMPGTTDHYETTTFYDEDTTTTGQHWHRSCCCTCCFESDYKSGSPTCTTCADHTVDEATTCATNKYLDLPDYPAPTSAYDISNEPDPQPVEGSKFPERVETRENFKAEEKLTETLANVNVSEKASLGSQAADLILDCQYAGYDCYLSDFATFYDPIHGNCYIFNSGWNSSVALKKSHRAGRRHGLHLILNIEQDEYVEEVGDTAGLRLVVHPQERMPFPADEGITVATGSSSSIGVRKVLIERQPDPYGDCKDASEIDFSANVYEEMYPVEYSTTTCSKTCYQQYVISRCGCADPRIPMVGMAFGDTNVRACDSSDIEQDDCVYEVSSLYNENKLQCNCPSTCRDIDFQLDLSSGVWPSNVQKVSVLQKLSPQIGHMLNDPSNPDKYKENIMKIEIFYKEFNFEQVREVPSYPPQNFLSDLGGVLGLWLGMSILTLFEYLEFVLDVAVFSLARRFGRNRVKSFGSTGPPQMQSDSAQLSMNGSARGKSPSDDKCRLRSDSQAFSTAGDKQSGSHADDDISEHSMDSLASLKSDHRASRSAPSAMGITSARPPTAFDPMARRLSLPCNTKGLSKTPKHPLPPARLMSLGGEDAELLGLGPPPPYSSRRGSQVSSSSQSSQKVAWPSRAEGQEAEPPFAAENDSTEVDEGYLLSI